MDRLTEQAVNYVDTQPAESWTDTFYMMNGSYDLTSCTCMLPTIVCRAMNEKQHNTAPSRQTRDMMTMFKTKMGEQNYKIFNALRHKAENKEKELYEEDEKDNINSDGGKDRGARRPPTRSTGCQTPLT